MNPQATQKNVDFGKTDIADLAMPINFSGCRYVDGCLARQAVGTAETRQSAKVFISRNLPRALLETGLAPCIATISAPVTPRSEAKIV